MSHIHHINDSTSPLPAGKTGTAKTKGSSTFENALNKVIDNETATKAGDIDTAGLSEIVSPAVKVTKASENVTGRTDDLLRLLDAYSSKLGDPGVTLKNIEPVLEKMNRNADELLEQARYLDQSDEPLRKIATQTAVTARTEYVKFQRGDYLS